MTRHNHLLLTSLILMISVELLSDHLITYIGTTIYEFIRGLNLIWGMYLIGLLQPITNSDIHNNKHYEKRPNKRINRTSKYHT